MRINLFLPKKKKKILPFLLYTTLTLTTLSLSPAFVVPSMRKNSYPLDIIEFYKTTNH